jgi:hypothetical protein
VTAIARALIFNLRRDVQTLQILRRDVQIGAARRAMAKAHRNDPVRPRLLAAGGMSALFRPNLAAIKFVNSSA